MRMTINDVGLALSSAHLLPSVYRVGCFLITTADGEYLVRADRLPEIYIDKTVQTDLFEYGNEDVLLLLAMDMVNSEVGPVKVFQGESYDTIVFRTSLWAESTERLEDRVRWSLEKIENAIDGMGHACEYMVRENGKRMESEMMEELRNPSPDSPWIQGKISS